MRMIDVIAKKRDGYELTDEEINFFITGYVNGSIPDYQASALLMAIYLKGMTDQEQLNLTRAMLHSGEQIDLSSIPGVKCDKHSTGGVGDKTSLVVAPLAAACGVKMAKMSGRGLGHTGGTLDKLESIPGFQIELTGDEFFNQVKQIGLAIVGQTANITPADKLLYALRDVTSTVDSIPLIASSIMSKKLASGADNIVLDVKVGNGAFMKDVKQAEKLAKAMVEIGRLAKRQTVATLTDMSEPLGCAVGNAVEVIEAIDTLKGKGPKDFSDLCLAFVKEILIVCGISKTDEEAEAKVLEVLHNGEGLERFKQMVKYQKGDVRVVDDYSLLPTPKEIIEVKAPITEESYVKEIHALKIGEAAMQLGAGRETKADVIDPAVGIVLKKKIGDVVNPNETIALVYTNGKNTDLAIKTILNAYKFSKEVVKPIQKIIKVIR